LFRGGSIDANCSPLAGLHPRPDRLEQLSSNIGTSENMLMRVYSENDAKTEMHAVQEDAVPTEQHVMET
jgi:hypothetical protein